MPGFDETFTVFVKSLGKQASQAMAAKAMEVQANAETAGTTLGGAKPGTYRYVDGVLGAPLENVRPTGSIVLQFDHRPSAVAALFAALRARSPSDSGRYRDAHFALLDGVAMDPLEHPSAAELVGVRRVTLSNPQPYARRLEIALDKSGRPFVKQVLPRIFESAMIAVRPVFAGLLRMDFTYIDLSGAYVATTNMFRRRNKSGRFRDKDRGKGISIRYPAITIDLPS